MAFGAYASTIRETYFEKLAGLLARLNRDLHSDTDPGKFLTLFCGLIDPSTRTLRWASAGHEPGLVLRARSEQPEQLLATGPPMGVLENGSWDAGETLSLASGDLLVLVTDGITEAQAPTGARYRRERVAEIASRHAGEPAEAICAAVLDDVSSFVIERSMAELEHRLQRTPTDEELASHMNVPLEDLQDNLAEISGQLTPSEVRSIRTNEVLREWRGRIPPIAGVERVAVFGQRSGPPGRTASKG